MGQCQLCKKEVDLPFTCSYCGQTFCDEHRLPENHRCPVLSTRNWKKYREFKTQGIEQKTRKRNAPIDWESVRAAKDPKSRIQKAQKSNSTLIVFLILVGVIGIFYLNDPTNFVSNISSLPEQISIQIDETLEQVGSTVEESREEYQESIQPPSTQEIEQYVFEYTNEERRNQGLRELEWDSRLAEIAREHSIDMAENDFYDHINLRGEDPTDRAKRHGYPLHKDLGGGYYSEGIAENIATMATGYVEDFGNVENDAESIARALVDAWMDSKGHRANILKPDYDRIGVGIAYDGSTYYLATQNFW